VPGAALICHRLTDADADADADTHAHADTNAHRQIDAHPVARCLPVDQQLFVGPSVANSLFVAEPEYPPHQVELGLAFADRFEVVNDVIAIRLGFVVTVSFPVSVEGYRFRDHQHGYRHPRRLHRRHPDSQRQQHFPEPQRQQQFHSRPEPEPEQHSGH
jgi:hypothetical protein